MNEFICIISNELIHKFAVVRHLGDIEEEMRLHQGSKWNKELLKIKLFAEF